MIDHRLLGHYELSHIRRDFERIERGRPVGGTFELKEAMRKVLDHADALARRVKELEALQPPPPIA